ncbi:MAG: SUMF1/EgtB/PvdO family nonheme iron enzyme [Deltaproteobacteria bacterium]|nr:SUMF1/EgtB/PvdO family nonheme iron enzyme [Deltaproteobacteria bacterium]
MGSELFRPDERPAHAVKLGAYYIDIYEVTYGDYMDCVRKGKCRRPRLGKSAGKNFPVPRKNWPVIGINWYDAENYCKWKHKRLPTEAEWEKAARGNTGNPYPWGDVIDCGHANYMKCKIGHPVQVGGYPAGKSPYGAMDMAGNAQEWVADWYDPDYYGNSPDKNPFGPSQGERKVLRGGSYDYVWSAVRTTYRYSDFPENHHNSYGFRCAASP